MQNNSTDSSSSPLEENINLIQQVQDCLDDLRPYLQNDGGDVEFLGIENQSVKLRLLGACSSCSISNVTLKLGIENYLKENIPQIKEVIEVT